MTPLLLLFDVDRTLFLSHDPVYVDAFLAAAETVFGIPLTRADLPDLPGATATEALRPALAAKGVHAGDGVPRWCDEFSQRYVRMLADADTSGWEAAPRAAETLASLERDHRLALLTGNPEPVARARMERLGLDRFFPAGGGGFGCEREDRTELVPLARERAGGWLADRTVLVGDTPRDVAIARAAGVRVVAVTTGRYGATELGAADAVVAALTELPAALT